MHRDTSLAILAATACAVLLGVEVALRVLAGLLATAEDAPGVATAAWLYAALLLSSIAAALALLAAPANRTEPYLRLIGLVVLLALAATTLLLGLRHPPVTMARVVFAPGSGLAWLRPGLALVAFWAILHYAMNPRAAPADTARAHASTKGPDDAP
ncbi:MAG: hypothetical protein AAGG54_05235 [Pseudomonadota bacterium]